MERDERRGKIMPYVKIGGGALATLAAAAILAVVSLGPRGTNYESHKETPRYQLYQNRATSMEYLNNMNALYIILSSMW